jgi:4-amino-4-deoxy-L-arabinose transferase-like glycosyltransferase
MHTEPVDVHPPVARWERVGIAVVTVAFTLWLVVWALLVPAFQAPDERAHVDATVQVALGNAWAPPGDLRILNAVMAAQQEQARLPAAAWSTVTELLRDAPGTSDTVDQMTQHPPTAYLVGAAALRVAHYGDLRWDRAVEVLRLVDVLWVAALPLLAWASVRRVTRSPRAALVGALALFATPQLASIASSVSNDAPVMLFGALVAWLASRLLTGDVRRRTLLGLGLALGVLIWFKGTGLPAIPFVAVVVLVAGAGVLPFARRVGRTLTVLVLAALVGAWWWLHNLVAFHHLQPNGYEQYRPPMPFPPGEGPSVATFLDVSWGTITRTFWGSPGGGAQVSIGAVLTAVLTVVALGVVLVWGFRRGPERRAALCLAVFPALLIAGQTWTSATSYLSTTFVAATQGRYYFPAIVCLVVLSAVAWRRIPRGPRGRRVLATVLAAASVVLGWYGLGVVTAYFWNGAHGPVTAEGFERFAATGPVPVALVGVLLALVAVALVVAVSLVARRTQVGAGAVPEHDADADRSSGVGDAAQRPMPR